MMITCILARSLTHTYALTHYFTNSLTHKLTFYINLHVAKIMLDFCEAIVRGKAENHAKETK